MEDRVRVSIPVFSAELDKTVQFYLALLARLHRLALSLSQYILALSYPHLSFSHCRSFSFISKHLQHSSSSSSSFESILCYCYCYTTRSLTRLGIVMSLPLSIPSTLLTHTLTHMCMETALHSN